MQIGEKMQKFDYEDQYSLVQFCQTHGLQTITNFWSEAFFLVQFLYSYGYF